MTAHAVRDKSPFGEVAMRARFEFLIRGVCSAVGFDSAADVIEGEPFSIDDIVFSLNYKPRVNETVIFAHVDFGCVPQKSKAEFYYALLRHNFTDFPDLDSTFGISPINGHVIYVVAYELMSLTIEALLANLIDLAGQAQRGRFEKASVASEKTKAAGFLSISGKTKDSPFSLKFGSTPAISARTESEE